jgi:predicted acylesterase/phospholipase RssA
MPGICVPAIREGIELFDGGMTDPLAIGALSYLGADRIIACCALRDPRHKRLNLKRKRMTSPRFRAFLRFLNSRLNPFAKGNVYDVVMRAVEAAQFRVLEHDLPEPDVVIRPSTTRLRWYAFHKPERYVEAGRRAAESKIEAIKTLVEAPVEKRRMK